MEGRSFSFNLHDGLAKRKILAPASLIINHQSLRTNRFSRDFVSPMIQLPANAARRKVRLLVTNSAGLVDRTIGGLIGQCIRGVTTPGLPTLSTLAGLSALMALSAFLLGGCDQHPTTGQSKAAPKNVLVTTVQRADIPVQIHEFGRVVSPESVNIQPQVSGRITEVHFVEGQDVKKGDLLFVIDPRPFQAQLEQSEAQLVSDTAQLELNRRNMARDVKIGPQHFVSEQQIDTDKANVDNFKGAVSRDQASIDLAKLNLQYCYVCSPGNGRTGRRLVDPGNYVSTGGSTLVNIQLQDPVYADFNISENDLARLRDNVSAGNPLKVDVTAPSRPEIVKAGDLSFFDNSVSPQAGTVLLRATVPNEDRYLWPGQYVNVALTLKVLKDALVVPSQTVQLGGKGTYLFVVKPDNTVEQRLVPQGIRYQDLVVVPDGVQAGETVVVEGQIALTNGTKVNPKEYPLPSPTPSSGGLTRKETGPNEPSAVHQESSIVKPTPAL
jgi:multidrug efflux system membrane fusion protein